MKNFFEAYQIAQFAKPRKLTTQSQPKYRWATFANAHPVLADILMMIGMAIYVAFFACVFTILYFYL